MKKIFLVVALFIALTANAQQNPLWMRQSSISPDGTTIAFSYHGDIYTVDSKGGKALQITTNVAYDGTPIWSPDGKKIAFKSDRDGNLDIYIVDSNGGVPKRLTTATTNEVPIAFKDNDHILFSANERPTASSIQFPSSMFMQLYEVDANGSRPQMISSLPMESISISKDGKTWLYQDKKGYENEYRKHHTSVITRDIWQYIPDKKDYKKLTSFKGEDRNPVWSNDGKSFYYLSEEDGTFNVYKHGLDADSQPIQLTHYKNNPVRFLSISQNGLLCFDYRGEIYTMKEGEEAKKIDINIIADKNDKDIIRQIKTSGAKEFAVSPNGKEVAFILRGDVFVTSTDYKTTKQITDNPYQERDLQFSPDGRSLIYSSERDGLWQIYRSSIARKDEKLFTYSTDLKEENIINSNETSFQPQYSPDGKEIAFLENRNTLRVINLKTKAVRTILDGKYEYSYEDGDIDFEWSPDSKWILCDYIDEGGWSKNDIALLNAKGDGKIVNLTESAYYDASPKWVLDGKAMIWSSDRAGLRSHGSGSSERDEYIMFFDVDAYDRFMMNKEDLALLEESEKAEKGKKSEEESKNKKAKKEDKAKKTDEDSKPLTLDLENCKDRVVRLTVNSSKLGDAILNKKGDKLYYISSFEGDGDLWVHDLKQNKTKILSKGIGFGSFDTDKDGNSIFFCSEEDIKKIDPTNGQTKDINFEATFNYRPAQEREYIFDHIWRQVNEKFYSENINGIDWEGYKKEYHRFLPYINNNYDFCDMLSEMLGELNGSHTGAMYYNKGASLKDASLGCFFDEDYKGEGLKIKEIIAKSPLTLKKDNVKAGDIIEKIDGISITSGMDFYPLLEGKIGKKVILTVKDSKGKNSEVTIKAISPSKENLLLYRRWVERNRAMVDKLSKGRLGYIHVKEMNSDSYRTLYSELLGKYRNKEAVIIDVRHNGGGWLHDDIATLLSGKEYQKLISRGRYIGSDPESKWTKPSCMLVCEDNYSNAHGAPWLYKELKIGKVIGTPIPGTMSCVWWERQIDPTIVFGIPQVACRDMRGNYLENQQLEPDILVYNNAEDVMNGKDAQIEAAVKEMLKEADEFKKAKQ